MTVISIYVYRCETCDEVRSVTEKRLSAATCFGPNDAPHPSRDMALVIESHIEVTADA